MSPRRRHLVSTLSVLISLLVVTACGGKKDVEHAKHSLYDADFALVYNAALQATRDQYPMLNDNPGPGKISTAWHSVSYANNQDDLQNQRTLAQSQGLSTTPSASSANTMSGVPTRLAYKRYFIRFDVSVIGGRPWRVKVIGHASEWDPGAALPTEMRGANKPSWLEPRIESLQVAIYKRIKAFAVPMKEEVVAPPDEGVPRTDPTSFKDVPAGAAKTLAATKDALAKRDYAALRPLLDDDIVWSLGGGTGADVALATWQADPGLFESMQAAITAGCAPRADKKQVACPPGEPIVNVYQLVLEERGGMWKITSFVKAE
jgi:hypothetical protein